MKNKIQMPKWFSEQFKNFTGLEPTYKDYTDNTLFKPRNKFEENPASAFIIFIFLGIFIIIGSIAVF